MWRTGWHPDFKNYNEKQHIQIQRLTNEMLLFEGKLSTTKVIYTNEDAKKGPRMLKKRTVNIRYGLSYSQRIKITILYGKARIEYLQNSTCAFSITTIIFRFSLDQRFYYMFFCLVYLLILF